MDSNECIKYPFRSKDGGLVSKPHLVQYKDGDIKEPLIPYLIPENVRYGGKVTGRTISFTANFTGLANIFGIAHDQISSAIVMAGLIGESGYPLGYPSETNLITMNMTLPDLSGKDISVIKAVSQCTLSDIMQGEKVVPANISAIMIQINMKDGTSKSVSSMYHGWKGGDTKTKLELNLDSGKSKTSYIFKATNQSIGKELEVKVDQVISGDTYTFDINTVAVSL